MYRLFVALRPPAPMRAALLGLAGGIAHARWQDDEQLHLTLRFIGEVDRHQAEDIAAALGTVHNPRISIALDGIGHFERNGRVDSLWAGVTPHAPLKALHNKIDQALIRVGVAPDGRAYLPHVTIARFAHATAPSPAEIAAFAARAGALPGEAGDVADFRLHISRMGRGGSIYSVVARYPLV